MFLSNYLIVKMPKQKLENPDVLVEVKKAFLRMRDVNREPNEVNDVIRVMEYLGFSHKEISTETHKEVEKHGTRGSLTPHEAYTLSKFVENWQHQYHEWENEIGNSQHIHNDDHISTRSRFSCSKYSSSLDRLCFQLFHHHDAFMGENDELYQLQDHYGLHIRMNDGTGVAFVNYQFTHRKDDKICWSGVGIDEGRSLEAKERYFQVHNARFDRIDLGKPTYQIKQSTSDQVVTAVEYARSLLKTLVSQSAED